MMLLQITRNDAAFWDRVKKQQSLWPLLARLVAFIVVSGALYGAVLAGWRSPRLSLYVAIKLPVLMLGTTSLVMLFNWIIAAACGSGLRFAQVVAVTWAAMAVAGLLLLSLIPVTLFFTACAAPEAGSHNELRYTHNCILITHILLIAIAGVAANIVLRRGLRQLVHTRCRFETLCFGWLAAFAFVGCQLSWILRPFVGSPFYAVAFLRPDCLDRNFYEFVFLEVLPFLLRGGT